MALGSAAAIAVAAPGSASSAVASAGDVVVQGCSETTARQLIAQHRLNDFDLPNPVAQLLCGPFTGPGSEAMAVAVPAPTCWPRQHWAVFRLVGGAWQLVLNQYRFIFELAAVGGDLRETSPVFRLGDSRCTPSGGKQARTWHWDGTQLVPSAWKQVEPGEPLTFILFRTPRGMNVECWMSDDPRPRHVTRVQCESGRRNPRIVQVAKLGGFGRVTVCRDTGRRYHCRVTCGCYETPPPTLGYGQEIVVGRFRCVSQRSGVTCTVTRSGRGFTINKNRVRRIGA